MINVPEFPGSGSFTNLGTITVSNGDTLTLNSSSWSNSGTITVTGGTLDLQGKGLTLAQLERKPGEWSICRPR